MASFIVGGIICIAIAAFGGRALDKLEKGVSGLLILLGLVLMLAGVLSKDPLDIPNISAESQALAAAIASQGLLYYRLQSTFRKEVHDLKDELNKDFREVLQRLSVVETKTQQHHS